jgi:hypothetical protein
MTSIKQVFSLVAILAVVIVSIASVSALGAISSIEVKGVEALNGANIAVATGETVPVQVVFNTSNDAQDVRVKAWILGEQGYSASTDRFDVIANHTYTQTVNVQMPSKTDPSEQFTLEVQIEDQNGIVDTREVSLGAQRDSYNVEVLDVNMDSQVKAGANLPLDIILKNVGSHIADDAFVVVRIPTLGVENKAYFGDLSPVDQTDLDNGYSDVSEKRINVAIPASAATGVYAVEIEAYNGDFDSKISRKVAVVGTAEDTVVLSSVASKTIAANKAEEFTMTMVNTGDKVKIYNLVFEAQNGLTFNVDEPVVVIPAGTSKTVKFDVTASKAGTYNFAANVYSDGQFVKKVDFSANAENKTDFAGNTTVLLTVILAIVFVVLLVVLIVLLTRKPEKTEEFGESYY